MGTKCVEAGRLPHTNDSSHSDSNYSPLLASKNDGGYENGNLYLFIYI
jgi:hypothetical protein